MPNGRVDQAMAMSGPGMPNGAGMPNGPARGGPPMGNPMGGGPQDEITQLLALRNEIDRRLAELMGAGGPRPSPMAGPAAGHTSSATRA